TEAAAADLLDDDQEELAAVEERDRQDVDQSQVHADERDPVQQRLAAAVRLGHRLLGDSPGAGEALRAGDAATPGVGDQVVETAGGVADEGRDLAEPVGCGLPDRLRAADRPAGAPPRWPGGGGGGG